MVTVIPMNGPRKTSANQYRKIHDKQDKSFETKRSEQYNEKNYNLDEIW